MSWGCVQASVALREECGFPACHTMFFGGYEDDDDDISETSSQKDELEDNLEDVAAELDLGEPSDELKDFARRNLGELPDTRLNLVQELRNVIYERGEVVPHRTDDSFLIRFLRARRFDVEKAHRLMNNYYSFKENNQELHEDVHPMNMRFIGDAEVLSVLPYREQTGRRIMIYKLGNWNPSSYSIEELFKATVVVLELAVLEQRAQILGGICIFDLGGISMQHAWQITPSIARRTVELMVIYFHGQDFESLHSHIDPKFLPKRYGGMRPEYRYTDWIHNFLNNETIIAEMEQLGYKFDLGEVKKMLDDVELEISSDSNVIMTSETSSLSSNSSSVNNNA
ncbi:alpha-tocopherol transfer protein isoform X3 [Cryptotermes secundus]|uniref:alpha-tocopherol transfer protein isoform X3 n=1 Tax=Cryptotermes secundus TaxID=105785 RepID=UPI001454BC5A|nr:alpha-tocopherol transfer protein isoform X3 [Cryptotermes secundus]